ncbi:hypothetical protein NE852_12855 [Rhizobium sp. Pop5]|uniref:hypothetical protein n=1 Tax=Rhizobium sp. Pop5 TaxID=1223565 RepID=UPI00028386EF|nr:hypothetical protein [Rhizobium sp. Pop5]EJZ17398.1 hypothetical protein RCCGEPOP_30964 [Rhizobium sp. Pop5]UVD59017.1 hypothetical protein NE852_12855 [Rhizobium sp. Pop5]
MAAEIRVLPVRALDVREVARRMRQADRDEVWKASGMSPVRALSYSLRKSSAAWTVFIDGRAEVIFGVGAINILAGVGAPWLLGTDAIERHAAGFLRGSIEWRDQLLRHYPILRNLVDADNRVSLRWLRWLGFSIFDPVSLRGHEFRPFELRCFDV